MLIFLIDVKFYNFDFGNHGIYILQIPFCFFLVSQDTAIIYMIGTISAIVWNP
jgi:hypothetical protein